MIAMTAKISEVTKHILKYCFLEGKIILWFLLIEKLILLCENKKHVIYVFACIGSLPMFKKKIYNFWKERVKAHNICYNLKIKTLKNSAKLIFLWAFEKPSGKLNSRTPRE